MKRLIVVMLFCLAVAPIQAQRSKVSVISTDVDNFWKAYDAIRQTTDSLTRIRLIHDLYISKATPGLKGMMQVRNYQDHEFVDMILKYPEYWNAIRPHSSKLSGHKKQIEKYFGRLGDLYPQLRPAAVYFQIGAFRSVGTYQGSNVLLGAEFLLAQPYSDLTVLPQRTREGMADYMPYNVPLLATLELVHTQQKRWETFSVAHLCVAEGIAEFISTLVAEAPLSPPVKFGKANEKRVVDLFMSEIIRNDESWNWLWNKNENELKVNDLGYYIGYEIAERYYNKAKDKKQAIRDLIELDYSNDDQMSQVVDVSGFLPLSWKEIGQKYEAARPRITQIMEFENGSTEVDPNTGTITVAFSDLMSPCCRSTENYVTDEAARVVKIKRFVGWSADKTKYSFEIEPLLPGTKYELTIGNFAKEDGGNRTLPFLIRFTTRK